MPAVWGMIEIKQFATSTATGSAAVTSTAFMTTNGAIPVGPRDCMIAFVYQLGPTPVAITAIEAAPNTFTYLTTCDSALGGVSMDVWTCDDPVAASASATVGFDGVMPSASTPVVVIQRWDKVFHGGGFIGDIFFDAGTTSPVSAILGTLGNSNSAKMDAVAVYRSNSGATLTEGQGTVRLNNAYGAGTKQLIAASHEVPNTGTDGLTWTESTNREWSNIALEIKEGLVVQDVIRAGGLVVSKRA